MHHIWEAIDPGSIVNPAIVEAQVNGAVALGLSQTLLEEAVYVNGQPRARNYDLYAILPPSRMAPGAREDRRAAKRWAVSASRRCRPWHRRWPNGRAVDRPAHPQPTLSRYTFS